MAPPKRTEKSPTHRSVLVLAVVALGGVFGIWWTFTPSRAALEQQAIQAILKNDLATAESALLRISPRDREVLQTLADLAFRRGRKADCIRWLENAADLPDTQSVELYDYGAKAFEFGIPAAAERIYRKAILHQPTQIESYSRLARLYLAWRRGNDLRQLIATADSVGAPLIDDPMLLWLWVVGDRIDWFEKDAEEWLKLVSEQDPSDVYATAALIRSAQDSSLADNPRKRSVIPLQPSTAWPIMLATVARRLESGGPIDAAELLKELPIAAEQDTETWFLRGQVASRWGEEGAALAAYQQATLLDPLYAAPLYQHGQLLSKRNELKESAAELDRATRVDELSQRCRQFLQGASLDVPALQAAMTLAASLGQDRWVQLVGQLAQRKSPTFEWPAELSPLNHQQITSLQLPNSRIPHVKFHIERTEPTSDPTQQAHDGKSVSLVQFRETTAELGLQFTYEYGYTQERWLMETLGGGVAVLDFDRDGWPDLFFAQGGPLPPSQKAVTSTCAMKRNLRGEQLRDVTTSAHADLAGFAHGCAVGDMNDDGFPDLAVCKYGGLVLLMNQGDGTWLDSTHELTGQDPSQTNPVTTIQSTSSSTVQDRWNTSAAWSDLNGDGYLDLYVAGYCRAPSHEQLRPCREGSRFVPCRPNTYAPETDAVLMNSGRGALEDQSNSLDIETGRAIGHGGYGLGVIAADFDQDGITEVFVGNDTTPNFLWHRNGVGPGSSRFVDAGLISGVALDGSGRAEACMGIACGDVDGDQQLDLFVTNFFDETCTFYQNLGNLQFDDRTQQVGLSNAGRRLMGWGCQFFDADNDGWLDLAIVNGFLHDTAQLPQFYQNTRGHFAERSSKVGPYFEMPKLGRSVATWDYNRDGRVDLVITNQTEPSNVLKNESRAGHFLTINLVGIHSPRDGTGAVIRARIGDRTILRLVSSQGGYLSACSSEVVIGLESATVVDDLQIDWPSGRRDHLSYVPADQFLVIREATNVGIKIEAN